MRLASTTIALTDGALIYYESLYAPPQAAALRARLQRDIEWEQHELQIFGRRVPAPRLSAWYGDPGAGYRYSGLVLQPRSWLTSLRGVKARVEQASGYRFNSVLCNLYRDGDDSVGWHSDDEAELGTAPVIASFSLGAARRFCLKHKYRRGLGERVTLADASLLVMEAPTQAYWRHALPKTRNPCAVRINLTFRQVLRANAD